MGVPNESNENGLRVNCDMEVPNREVRVNAPADLFNLLDEGTRNCGTRDAPLRVLSGTYKCAAVLTGHYANASIHPQSNPMTYLDENGSSDPTPAIRWFNIHPDLAPTLASDVASIMMMFNTPKTNRGTTEEPGSTIGLSTNAWIRDDDGESGRYLAFIRV